MRSTEDRHPPPVSLLPMRRLALVLVLAPLAALACFEPSTELSVDAVSAPPGFDVEGCAHIGGPTVAGGAAAGSEEQQRCSACCLDKGLHDSSFILDNSCVCANLAPPVEDSDVCLASASPSNCQQCCQDAAFAFARGGMGNCTCLGPEDATYCQDAFEYDDPFAACTTCCVEIGYLGIEFQLGNPGQTCICTR